MLEWTYSGVNWSIEGTGGVECIQYLPYNQILFESTVISVLAILCCVWSLPRLRLPYKLRYKTNNDDVRRMLLMLHGVTFGVEVGFKLATKSLIWILNPCHTVTILQLIILAMPSTPLTTGLFRLQVHMINGPIMALLFPVVNTRLLQCEQLVYYVQHFLIVCVPMYLMKSEGVFNVEPLRDMSYAVMSLGLQTLYHFWLLQYVGFTTLINLDNMFCPAISDPFQGINYRKWAVLHQSTLILFHGKILTLLSNIFVFFSYSNKRNIKSFKNNASNPSISENGDVNTLTPDEAYLHNDLEIHIRDLSIRYLFRDQSESLCPSSILMNNRHN